MFPALLLLLVTAVTAATDYCSISSCSPPSDQTLCLYPTDGAAAACGTVVQRGVTAADRTAILTAHNTIRQDVKSGQYAADNLPAAQTMPDLTWNAELATVAQRWADQCVDGHDQCRNVPGLTVGQNIASAWSMATTSNWAGEAVGQWFDSELPLFTQQDLTFRPGTGTGHLTQVIWADTTMVGCGFIAVEDKITHQGTVYDLIKRTYVCNYGPAGNIMVQGPTGYVGQQIYVPA